MNEIDDPLEIDEIFVDMDPLESIQHRSSEYKVCMEKVRSNYL